MQKSLASVLGLVLFIPACSSVFVDDDAERDRESAGESALERAAERHPGGVYQRWQARLSADGTMPDNALPRAKAQRDAMLAACGPAITGSQVQWTWLGPGNVGGRIRAVVLHPTNPLRIWCSSAGGGVWRTDDGGASWQPLNNVLGMLGSGCLVLDPTDANHLYLGTGEGFFETVEGSSNTAVLRGAGIWQSFDAGQTWAQIASTATPDFYFINRLAFSAADPHIMLAATGSGIWRSTDAGVTWSQRTTARTLDVDFHPTDGSQAVAGRDDGFALWSGDGGLSWNPAINPTLSTRIEVAYSRSNPTIVYCCANDVNDTLRVWRSGNGGHNYALQSATGIGTLGLYLSCLWVDPTNSNNIVFGGQTLYRSTDGGVTRTAFSGAHPDFHVAVEAPGFNGVINRRLYVGCDGGVFTRADWQTGSWTELNNQLGVTQFYGAAMSSTGVLLGGAQDNGTNRYTGGTETWNVNVIGGDGGHCAADPTDANYFYGESQYLGIARSSNAGLNWSDIRGATTGDPGFNFIPYFQLDPNNSNRMLACGRALWRTNNVKTGLPPTWTQIKPPRSCTFLGSGDPPPSHYLGNPPCNHSASAVALGNSDVIWVGHNDGEVYRTSNGTAAVPTWTQVDTNGTGLPDRWVSSIVIDPSNHQHVLVSLMGYEPDNVWETNDNGASWQPIFGSGAGALPSLPANWLVMHPRVHSLLFVGTDLGLFLSNDGGQAWLPVTGGPENVCAEMLFWHNERQLVVVTHGRGAWIATLPVASATPVGAGCAVGTPPLLAAAPPVVGAVETFSLTGASANALVWVGLSFGFPVPQNFGSCVVQVDLANSTPFATSATSASGTWSFNLTIPPIADLVSAPVVAQTLILDAGGPLLGAGDLSNGLQLTLGF